MGFTQHNRIKKSSMSYDIPFEIQVEIVKRLPVKSVIQFRSVSKAWKSLIDSSDFVSRYSGQQQHLLVSYYFSCMQKYFSVFDDGTFLHVPLTIPPLLNRLMFYNIVGGSCHGLLCLYGYYKKGCDGPFSGTGRAVIWNPSVRKAVDVVVPNVGDGIMYETVLGFGVCCETSDPKIVKITHFTSHVLKINGGRGLERKMEIFTLSTGAWRNPYGHLPRESIGFRDYTLAIGGFLYWLAYDMNIAMDGEFRFYNLIISFDITSEEFREVNLPDSLAHFPHLSKFKFNLLMCKLRESLVVVERCVEDATIVWRMEDNGSFTRLFTFNTPNASIRGFRKTGEAIIAIKNDESSPVSDSSLAVYEPDSKQINDLGITGFAPSPVLPYNETLLLLDQPDFIIY